MSILDRSEAATTILKAAKSQELPDPSSYSCGEFVTAFNFANYADLADWALWAEAVIATKPLDSGTLLHTAEGVIYDEHLELLFVDRPQVVRS